MMFRSLARYKLTGTVGVILLGVIFGVGSSGNTTSAPHHVASHSTCQLSILSCLTRRLSSSATSIPAHTTAPPSSSPSHPQPSTPSSTQLLDMSALGSLQGNLSSQDAQIILSALTQLPASAGRQITGRLDALTSADASILGKNLTQVFTNDNTDAQGYANTLVGVSGFENAVLNTTTAELNAISELFQPLPSAFAGGNTQISLFVSEVLSTTVPYIESLLENALHQVPQVARPLVLAASYRILEQNTPTDLGNIAVLLLDPKAQLLLHDSAYQAQLDCTSAQGTKCTAYDRFIISTAAARTAPFAVQQDFVSCGLAPLCTAAQSQVVISWAKQASPPPSASSISTLASLMQADSYATAAAWIDAL